MKERPILFSGPMVRAILDGRKTQTRRAVKPHRADDAFVLQDYEDGRGFRPYRSEDGDSPFIDQMEIEIPCPYGKPGDRLWLRETWGYFDPDGTGQDYDAQKNEDGRSGPCGNYCDEMLQAGNPLREYWRRRIAYAATWQDGKYGATVEGPKRWRPSIHMPRWASRILLEIVSARVERLQDISEADALAEGVEDCYKITDPTCGEINREATDAFRDLWQSINGPESWQANPWVWVVEFRVVKP